jgi:hypothetical protein
MGRVVRRRKRAKSSPSIESLEVIGDYSLRFTFDDGYVGVMNFDAEIGGRIWKDIHTPEDFASVRLDDYGFVMFWGEDESTALCAHPADGLRFSLEQSAVQQRL